MVEPWGLDDSGQRAGTGRRDTVHSRGVTSSVRGLVEG